MTSVETSTTRADRSRRRISSDISRSGGAPATATISNSIDARCALREQVPAVHERSRVIAARHGSEALDDGMLAAGDRPGTTP